MPEDQGIEQNALKAIVKGAGIYFIGLFISKILSYFLRLFIARYYGPSDYGLFSLGLAVVSLFVIFGASGLPTGVTRYIAKYKAKNDKSGIRGVVLSSFEIVFSVSVLLVVVLFLSAEFISTYVFSDPQLIPVIQILSISIPFSAGILIFLASFVGFQNIKNKVIMESIIQNILKLVLVVLFGVMGFGLLGFSWAWTISTAATFLIAFLVFEFKVFPLIRKGITSVPLKRKLMSYSFPLIFSGFLAVVVGYMDTLMIGVFRSSAEVGIYNAALPTAQLLLVVPFALTSIFLPIITELYTKGKTAQLASVQRTVTRWIFYTNLPLLMVFALFSQQALRILFGEQYVSGYLPLIILSFGYFLGNSIRPFVNGIEMMKKTRIILYISIFNFVLNFSLNYILIPSSFEVLGTPINGMTGAAIATMMTYVSSFFLVTLISYRYTRVNPFSNAIIRSVACAFLSVSVIYAIKEHFLDVSSVAVLAVFFVLYMLLYVMLLIVLRCFKEEDMEIIKTAEKKLGLNLRLLRKLIKISY